MEEDIDFLPGINNYVFEWGAEEYDLEPMGPGPALNYADFGYPMPDFLRDV